MASIVINPTTFPANSKVTATITGTSTTFVQGTSAITSTITGLSFSTPVVSSTTSLTVIVTCNSAVGASGTVTESTSSSTANVMTVTPAAYILAGNSPALTSLNTEITGSFNGGIVFAEVYKDGSGVLQTLPGVSDIRAK